MYGNYTLTAFYDGNDYEEVKEYFDYDTMLKKFFDCVRDKTCRKCWVTYPYERGVYTVTQYTKTLLEYTREEK